MQLYQHLISNAMQSWTESPWTRPISLMKYHIFIASPPWNILWMKGLGQELSERGSKKGALKAVKSCRKKAKINNISFMVKKTDKKLMKWNHFNPRLKTENISKLDLIFKIVLSLKWSNQNSKSYFPKLGFRFQGIVQTFCFRFSDEVQYGWKHVDTELIGKTIITSS